MKVDVMYRLSGDAVSTSLYILCRYFPSWLGEGEIVVYKTARPFAVVSTEKMRKKIMWDELPGNSNTLVKMVLEQLKREIAEKWEVDEEDIEFEVENPSFDYFELSRFREIYDDLIENATLEDTVFVETVYNDEGEDRVLFLTFTDFEKEKEWEAEVYLGFNEDGKLFIYAYLSGAEDVDMGQEEILELYKENGAWGVYEELFDRIVRNFGLENYILKYAKDEERDFVRAIDIVVSEVKEYEPENHKNT